MKTTIDMAREVYGAHTEWTGAPLDRLEQLVALVRADQREIDAKVCEEFARKWWKIHCDSNLHYSSTLKAHQDFCALQAAIRARSKDAAFAANKARQLAHGEFYRGNT